MNNIEVDVLKSLKWPRDFHSAVTTVKTNNIIALTLTWARLMGVYFFTLFTASSTCLLCKTSGRATSDEADIVINDELSV